MYASKTELCKELKMQIYVYLLCLFKFNIPHSESSNEKKPPKFPIIYSATPWYFRFDTYILDMTNDGSQCDSSASSCFFNGSPGSPEFPATTD